VSTVHTIFPWYSWSLTIDEWSDQTTAVTGLVWAEKWLSLSIPHATPFHSEKLTFFFLRQQISVIVDTIVWSLCSWTTGTSTMLKYTKTKSYYIRFLYLTVNIILLLKQTVIWDGLTLSVSELQCKRIHLIKTLCFI